MKIDVFFAIAIIACVAAETSEKPPCICQPNIEPTCGADGVTYDNPCSAACAGTTVAYAGECGKPSSSSKCFGIVSYSMPLAIYSVIQKYG